MTSPDCCPTPFDTFAVRPSGVELHRCKRCGAMWAERDGWRSAVYPREENKR